jgi:cytochrome c-type biogenesis protein CcmF
LFLTGVGPLLAWRKTSFESMRRIFMGPTIVGLVTAIVTVAMGARSIYAIISFGLAGFVTTTLVSEFSRAARARRRNTGESIATALVGITATNKRRYGGYIVHFGFVILMIGFTGQAFTTEGWGEVNEGDKFAIGHYEFECTSIKDVEDPNFVGMSATVNVLRDGKKLATLSPEKRHYAASDQTTSEVRIHHTLREDVYVVFANVNEESGKAVMQVWINPLVQWVWIGGFVIVLGTMVTLLPNRRERSVNRQKEMVERLLAESERTVAR